MHGAPSDIAKADFDKVSAQLKKAVARDNAQKE